VSGVEELRSQRSGQTAQELADRSSGELIRAQVRGSSLLLAGRVIQLAVNMAVQLMIVRYLSKVGYGAFAYALATATLAETIALFGLDRAVARLMPIYLEKRDYRTAFGVLALSIVAVLGIGAALVALILLSSGTVTRSLISDHRAVQLLIILIALAPIQALEDLLVGTFGVLAKPRVMFVRTYVLAPSFRLAVGILLIITQSSVYFLAVGYVVSAGAGLVISFMLLFRILRAEGLLEHLNLRSIRLPIRETFAFTLPLLSTDLVNVLLFSSDALLLGHFRGSVAVASFRVIVPLASLNMVPASVFTLLYVPLASRFFAREDHAGINAVYSRTSLWVAIICFPVFAFSFSGAGALTVGLYGSRYATSAVFLSLLAVGYYVQAALGFSGLTLMVFGRVRVITLLNVAAMVVNVAINLVLIPVYGALGAAIGTCVTLVVYNAVKQVLLRLSTGVRLISPGVGRPLTILVLSASTLMLVHPLIAHHAAAGLVAAAIASTFVIIATRHSLDVAGMFPEVGRLPLIGRLLASGVPPRK
jgi:O-antigen/teichoic acid export membrane protein